MLLLIDAGNTQIKWAVPQEASASAPALAKLGDWQHAGCCAQVDSAQLAVAWEGLSISHVLIANVAGAECAVQLRKQLLVAFGGTLEVRWFASQPELAGLQNKYANPFQLGCDRFASAIGAHALFAQQALLIVTCGTATTVDAVSADGDFLGGMILPGLGLMAHALGDKTAQLPTLTEAAATRFDFAAGFATNTADAIHSGCVAAQLGAIQRALSMCAARPGLAHDLRLILAGGAAPLLAAYLTQPTTQIDNLVLIGLQWVAMKDKGLC